MVTGRRNLNAFVRNAHLLYPHEIYDRKGIHLSIDLIMVIHCHQPVGNFDHVFNMAHDKCYRPLLDLIEAFPEVKVGLHFSVGSGRTKVTMFNNC